LGIFSSPPAWRSQGNFPVSFGEKALRSMKDFVVILHLLLMTDKGQWRFKRLCPQWGKIMNPHWVKNDKFDMTLHNFC
jgi:hypothetical protein